jgi:crotonobetainyl-CoA:carnitine CoA-transferase CaiB-like acyl-CoA transferase
VSAPLLAGITVLDFTRVLAGPYCTRLMADLGARVLKVERPRDGDEMRRGYLQIEPGRDDQSTYFIRLNAGKRSVAIDLTKPGARAVVADLARHADVVVENFVPGIMARFGCDYAALTAVKPDLVYCSISGFGQTGPMRGRPAFAHIVNAISGVMHLEQQESPAPAVGYLQTADVLAGTHAFGVILAALLRRGRTGAGAYLDVSMLEALVAAEDISTPSVLNGGAEYPGPRPGMVVHEVGGRYLALQTVGAPDLFPRLAGLLGPPDIRDDPRFGTPDARRAHWPELRARITGWLDSFKSVEDAVVALAAGRIPCAPVRSPAEVIADPHLHARGAFADVDHPGRGHVRINAVPFHVDGGGLRPAGPAPYRVGEHTRAVLAEVAGYTDTHMDELRGLGVIADAS